MTATVTYLGMQFRVGTDEQIRQAISEAKIVYINEQLVYCIDHTGVMYCSPRSAHPPVVRQRKE